MGHITKEPGTDAVGYVLHPGVVDKAAVGGGTSDDELRAEEVGGILHGVVVDLAGGLVKAVGHGLEIL